MSVLKQKQHLSIIYHLKLPRPGPEAACVHNLSCPTAETACVHNIPCPGTEADLVYNLPCPGTETAFVLEQKQPLSIICHVLEQKQPLCPSFTTLIYPVLGQNCMLNLPACFTGGNSSSQCQDRLSNCADYGQNACVGQYVSWAKENCPKTCNLCPSKLQTGGLSLIHISEPT